MVGEGVGGIKKRICLYVGTYGGNRLGLSVWGWLRGREKDSCIDLGEA